MRKNYMAPRLTVDEYVQDTMIASGVIKNGNPNAHCGTGPKNGNFNNNQNCWGSDAYYKAINSKGDYCTAG